MENVVRGSCFAVTGMWWASFLPSLLENFLAGWNDHDDFLNRGEDEDEDESEDEASEMLTDIINKPEKHGIATGEYIKLHVKPGSNVTWPEMLTDIINKPEKHGIATGEYIKLHVKPGSNVTWPDERFLLIDEGEDMEIADKFKEIYSDTRKTTIQRQARARQLLGRVPNKRTITFFSKDATMHMNELLLVKGVDDANKEDEKVPDSKLQIFLEEHFLAPKSWAALRPRPFSLFGSIFSHIKPSHISANLASLHL